MKKENGSWPPPPELRPTIAAELENCFDAIGKDSPANFDRMVDIYCADLKKIPTNQISHAFQLARQANESFTVPTVGKIMKAWKGANMGGKNEFDKMVIQAFLRRFKTPELFGEAMMWETVNYLKERNVPFKEEFDSFMEWRREETQQTKGF